MLSIKLNSVPVDDQQKALEFYTNILGFEKRLDIPMGEYRWLTVGTKGKDEVELLLEPLGFPPAVEFQRALFEAGIPFTAFASDDVHADYQRMKEAGAVFRGEPTNADGATVATVEDTCGNLVQIYEVDP